MLSTSSAKDPAPAAVAAPLAEVDPELLAEATRQQDNIRAWLDAPVLALPFCYLYALDNGEFSFIYHDILCEFC